MSQGSPVDHSTRRRCLSTTRMGGWRVAAAVSAAALALLQGGCEHDSYMDPSRVGRFEHTPTITPVLERLSAVEGPGAMSGEYAKVTAEDLTPEVDAYRVDAGDGVEILVNEIFNPTATERFERVVDPRGFIDVPQLPAVYVAGMTSDEAAQTIATQYKARRILNEPVVSFNVAARRRLTFNVMGGVAAPGTYQIPRPDFRLLEALSQGGRFQEQTEWVYVIRSIPLSEKAAGRFRPGDMTPSVEKTAPGRVVNVPPGPGQAPAQGKSVLDIVDELGSQPPLNQPKAPGMVGAPGDGSRGPMIDIDATSARPSGRTGTTTSLSDTTSTPGASRWVFVNGQWVAASALGRPSAQGGRGVNVNPATDVITQRVLQIPMSGLLSGSAEHNVVIRPGDIIRVPAPSEGLVYVEGSVQRPGPYSIPTVGRLTLQRAIVAAGGLNEVAIPERMDITRFVGTDRQATVRLNFRAIKEGTQPDLYLRDGDIINVGTNFWAQPLAVIRNGFRASYGFGFILDRNFGFDVFGPQRTSDNNF